MAPAVAAFRELEAERAAARAATWTPSDAPSHAPRPLPVRAPGRGIMGRTGAQLPAATRSLMERGLGHDFGRVRVHDDAASHRAAAALGASAFTVAHEVFFAPHAYAPATRAGRALLAHELAHVVQQAHGAPLGLQPRLIVEDPNAALPGAPPREHWEDVRDYVRALSSGFDVIAAGDITPAAATCGAPARTTDQCLCDLHASANDWKVKIDDVAWPHTEEANHRVTVHSSRSPIEFGAWGGGAQAGTRIAQDNARVLGHELCGHAWLMERGTHPTGPPPVTVRGRLMGRPSHDPTVDIENIVAGEMTAGAPQRGRFADPHHGESFARVTVSGFPTSGTDPATLSPDMLARLVRAKDAMASSPLMRADVVGHSDHAGTPAVRNSVSRARARAVRSHLRALGVGGSHFLEVRGHGDAECPAGPADNPACRKVEVFMFLFQGSSLRNP